jgi:hypothetical protein
MATRKMSGMATRMPTCTGMDLFRKPMASLREEKTG